ncbi:hypothetical protein BE17_05640 [Sorangium cellulosum]|uniref:Isoquinoline 1-oxidoreductase subunit n=1 Tax=Sorangium cellulosum TaxID=56 RepID=A0A150RZN2_SORCE|nr:hypothetical protein BE17_05640 [Sorangium cellulosum]
MIRSSLVLALLLAGCGGQAPGASQAQPPSQAPASREAGLAAFETVRGVLQHPRCQNCHPAGDVPLQGDEGRLHNQYVLRGPTGHGMAGAECTTCHGPTNPPNSFGMNVPPGVAKGWHMPPPDMKMVFVGVAPRALCEQVKDPARNGGKDMAALRVHLEDPLVTWGWNPGAGRTPIPTPYAEFVAAWETWARAGAPCPGG